MRWTLVAISLIGIVSGALAVEDGDVLFFAPYEDSVDAVLAGGGGAAEATGTPRFDEGVRGRAAVLDADALLSYLFKDNVVPTEGTVMMWFKPQWAADDDKFHNLFRASTGNDRGKALNAIMLYKYPRWSRLLLYTSDGQLNGPQSGRSMAYKEEMVWEPGTWHHAAVTWSATLENIELNLYFDGERIAAGGGQVFVPDEAPVNFEIGGPEGSGETWVDDVMVLGRPLMAPEIKGVYDAYGNEQIAAAGELPFVSSRELGLKPYLLFGRDQLVVLADYRGARRDLGEQAGTIQVAITRDDLNEEGQAATVPAGTNRIAFDLKRIGPGPVTIEATLRDGAGTLLREGALAWTVPVTPEWVNNDLGKTDEVPEPWTPVKATVGSVEVWGRTYSFGGSPLPAQVVSGEHELLRGPIAMRVDGHPLSAQPAGEPGGTEQMATQEWAGTLGALTASATTQVEYDGFMRVDLTITPAEATTVSSLELRMPMRADTGTLYHHCDGEWTNQSDAGAVGEQGWSKALPFLPYVWLGNEERGMVWWCESNWNWRSTDAERAIEIVRVTDGTDLVVRMIDGETALTEPMTVTFGFMATPVKPLPEGWRNWNAMFISALNIESFAEGAYWRYDGMRNIGMLWNNHVGSFSYLPADPAEMKRKVGVLRDGGWDPMVSYYATNCTQVGTPDCSLAEEEIRRDPYSEATMSIGNYGTTCQASVWSDMLLWIIDQTMEQTGTDGVYLDCSNPRYCKSDQHECGHGRYPLLGTRELQKRIYNLVRSKRGEEGFVYSHVSESVMMTTYSFSDCVLNGEQYNKKDLATLDRAKFRAEFLPTNTGVPQMLLPTLVKFQKKGEEKMPGAEFLAFPLLHDVICLPQWMLGESRDLLREIRKTMVAFGVGDAEFLPYWSNAEEIGLSSTDAAVSAYLRADGKALLLIAQGAEEPMTLSVELRGRLAAMTDAPARDAVSGEAMAWHGGKLQWLLPGRGVQLAIVELAQ